MKIPDYSHVFVIAIVIVSNNVFTQPVLTFDKEDRFDWIQTARVFLMDAYQPPFAPELEYDAKALVETMVDMNANVVRFSTMGKYSTIQGVRFSTHPDQGDRDLLSETIKACKPEGIKVIPYISTGHKLAWSMLTESFPEYAHKATPEGQPNRSHMFVGEDHGTVCWMGPYRKAYLDYVEHVVRDYDIEGIYFDAWFPHYFWEGKSVCYCDGCRNGFRKATGLEIPYHENEKDYSEEELSSIQKYHEWYKEEYITKVILKVRAIIKSYKDIPLISNINNPVRLMNQDPRITNSMDAFLYERGHTILERAEGVSLARSVGLHIWPYVGVYHNWPRLAFQGFNYQQQIFTNLMFGGGSIIAQPTGYISNPEHREYVRYPFDVIKNSETVLSGMENYPYVGVVFAYHSPEAHIQQGWLNGPTQARNSTLGAFAACLYNHIQVSSVCELVLDDPKKMKKYPVLYLANIPFLSDERIRNITDYVYSGGSLVVSNATALFDVNGNRQTHFGLEKLIRVRPVTPTGELAEIVKSYQSMLGGPNDLYLVAEHGSITGLEEKWHNRLFPLWFYEPVEVLDGGEVLMNIVTGYDRQPILPGVVLSNHGKGHVIYCASAMESFYESLNPDLIGELIQKFVEIVSNEPAPYSLEAPESLIANLTESKNRMVLHLTNWTGNKFEKPWRNEYYLAPVENVRLQIHIPEENKIKCVTALVDTDFETEITGQNLQVFFPRIESYQGVVIEYE